ncbi:hypothetical protein E4U42_001375 [Claviceps africana]|uniref:Glutamine amidotransferase type-2 domain-containing protein n=1 Tax=Claviceps africana TaxID=83212 RepID=A0A8K0NEH0_9HYPO|nr:hypothetical protein E4U42_001375 [Claviceps africana]
MCGIHAAIYPAGTCPKSATLERRLRNRGPDHHGTVTTCLDRARGTTLALTSTVLSLRGDHVAEQPLVDGATGSVLCWNGEAWRIRGREVRGNDGEAIMALLGEAGDDDASVLRVLRDIEGPFAFIYYDKAAGRLYYGRDRLGRRSLLVTTGGPFVLASLADACAAGDWAEVEADGVYVLELPGAEDTRQLGECVPVRHDWVDDDDAFISGIARFNSAMPRQDFCLTRHSDVVGQLHRRLVASLRPRVLQVPLPPGAAPTDARVAVLFSGGLDCTVLARLASDLLPGDEPVDLLNVAFENPRIAAQHKGVPHEELYELCPDRITARKSFAELVRVCPARRFRLVTINVPFTLTSSHRSEVVELMYPHRTEMDLSIASALYFAARGDGLCQTGMDARRAHPYRTTARVLLSGLGADELFGGYTRHATSYHRRGYEALVDELRLDVSRLGKRNLGRDDRIMAHWGKEVRFPYLDEDFVRWAMGLPVWEKCDFAHPEGDDGEGSDALPEPGKRILRLLAQELGMRDVAREKKRAIQFGARTAKMESSKVKGTTPI